MGVFYIIAKNTWSEYMQYRLNFIMWRVRNVMRLVVIYFLWWAIFSVQNQVFGYNQSQLLTYILLSSFIGSIVYSTRTQDIGGDINRGNLSNLLLKPVNVFFLWTARDIGDKTLNILFSIAEILLLVFILKPPLFIQSDLLIILIVAVFVFISNILYYLISLILSFFGFWSPDVWGPRFLLFIILEFFAGGLFPLDILPKVLYKILHYLPFNYLIFFPIKIYLGNITNTEIIKGIIISLGWVVFLYIITLRVWKKGLSVYSAYGR